MKKLFTFLIAAFLAVTGAVNAQAPCSSTTSLTVGVEASGTVGTVGVWDTYASDPSSTTFPGEEKVYSFTPLITGYYSVKFLSSSGNADLILLYSCNNGDVSGLGIIDDALTDGIPWAFLEQGTTYYAVVDNRSSANSADFTLLVKWEAEGTASAVYQGDGQTMHYNYVDVSTCPVPLGVTIPAGKTVVRVDVEYDMTAQNGAWMSEQRSYLKCVSAGGTSESYFASGAGNAGTFSYSRQGLDIADNVLGDANGEVVFQLHAFRTWTDWSSTEVCGTTYNKVDAGTFAITVYYDIAPPCPKPTGLALAERTTTTAKIAFEVSGDNVNTVVPEIKTEIGEWFVPFYIVNDLENPLKVELSGLTLNTSYQIRLKSDCQTDGFSVWSDTLLFSTALALQTLPVNQDFESVDYSTIGLHSSSSSNRWFIGSTTAYGGTGNSLYITNDDGVSNAYDYEEMTYAYTEMDIDFGNALGYKLSFDWKGGGEDEGSPWDVMQAYLVPLNYILTSASFGSGSSAWLSGEGVVLIKNGSLNYFSNYNGDWESFSTDLAGSTYSGTTKKLLFVWFNDDIFEGEPFAIDNIKIDPVTCVTPYFTSDGITITHNGGTFDWESNATDYNVVVSRTPLTTVADIEQNITASVTKPLILDSLQSTTQYYLYVQADCGAVGLSEWTGVSFETPCTPLSSFPAVEPFATTSIPDCWKRYSGLYNGTSMNAADLTEYSGGWNFYQALGSPFGTSPFINIWGNSYRYWLVSPLYTLPAAHNLNLIFDLALTKYNTPYNTPDMNGTDDKFIVFVSTDNGATWTSTNATVWNNAGADSVYNNISPAGQKITIPLSAYSGNIQIAFYGESTASNADNNLHIDNVAVREISSENAITSFSLAEQTSTPVIIDATNHTVDIEVGYGVELNALVPAITVSQYATVSPASGVVQDFSQGAVTYTVTAEDGTAQNWTVTVTASSVASTENAILTFSIPKQVSAEIDGANHTITVEMPWTTTNVTALVPTFTVSPFATVSPASGVAIDFTDDVIYTVTAQDLISEQQWTVKVSIQPIPYSINQVPFTRDFENVEDNNYFIFEHPAADATNLWAIGSAVSDPSGGSSLYISNNGGTNFAYSAVAGRTAVSTIVEFGDFADYTLSFKWKGGGEYAGSPWDVMKAYLVPLTYITPFESFSGQGTASWLSTSSEVVLIPNGSLSYFGNYTGDWQSFSAKFSDILPGTYSGTTKRLLFAWYNDAGGVTNAPFAIDSVSITGRPYSNENDITGFSIPEQTSTPVIIDATNHTVDIEVGYGVELNALVPAITVSQYATVLPASGVVQDFSQGAVTYIVTAEDGTAQNWTVTVTASSVASTENAILTFSIPQQVSSVIDVVNHTITVEMPWTTTNVTALVPTFTVSPFATALPVSGVAIDFSSGSATYTVTAQDGISKQDWTVTLVSEPIPYPVNTVPFTRDFENTSEDDYFFFEHPTANATNLWAIGSAVSDPSGGRSLYISNNGGTSFAYTGTIYGRTAASTIVDFGNFEDYTLSFKWKGGGESANSSYDVMQAYLVPLTYTPSISSLTGYGYSAWLSGPGVVLIPNGSDSYFRNYNGDWQSFTATLSGSTYSGTTQKLLFVWSNNNYTNGRPFAIDSIQIEGLTCQTPHSFNIQRADTVATIDWVSNSNNANIIVSRVAITDFSSLTGVAVSKPLMIDTLQASTQYYLYLQADCGNGDITGWNGVSFETTCTPVSSFPAVEPFATTSIPDCWKRYSGLYNGTSMNAADLTEYSGGWNFYQIAGSPFGTSPFINIWGNSYRYWLVSPLYTLPDAHNLNLIFDLALTKYNSPYNTPDMTGTDDKFIVFVSVDNGATWTDANSTVWSNNPANADSVYNNISPAGQKITIPLSAYSGNIQIAFYGETTMSNADNNLHIDNVAVREISSAKAITSFSLVEQTGAAVIDQDNYTVDIEVGYGTGLDALVPAIEVSQYATILPASGMVQDFSSPVTYTVTAEDGSYQAWTVTVTAASVPSTENDILTFSVPNQLGQSVIDNTNHTVSVTVPFNTTTTQLSALVPTFTVSPFATAVPGSGVAQDFNSTVSYEVTAQDGVNVETWTVTVTVEPVPSGAACSNPIAYTINAPRVSTLTNELSRQAWFAVTLDHDYHDVIWSTDGTAFDTKLFVVQSDCSQKPTQSSGNNSGDYLWYTDDGGTGTTTLASVISYLRRANVRNTAGLTGTYTGVFPAGTYYVVATPFDSYEAITNEVKLLVTGTLSVVPSVSTDSSSLVGETSARLHKTVTVSVPATYRPITSGGFRIRAVGDTYWDDIISASPYTSTSELVTGLTGGQTYEYYAFIQTGSGEDLVTYRGNTLTFTTDEPSIYPPTVVTDSVSSITQTSAQLYKTVTERTESITAEGFKWKQIGGGSESDSQDGALTGLSANTDYQFRAYATTETGTVYGDVLTFSTLAHVAPTVVTDAATSITQTSAQLNKTVTQGSEVITAEGYKWKQAASGEAEADSQDGTLTNLSAGTEYQFRAYATTASGTVYGSTLTFTALAHVAPTVLTLDATSVDKTTAQLNSTVTAGTEPIDEQGYWYRAVGGEYVKSLDGALTGLTENTDYEFYAYATTASGTVRDEEHIKTFKTLQTGLTLINDNLVTIYPNPANYIATMAIEGLYGDAQVTVTDIAGKTVANLNISAGTNLLQINVSNFTEGTYLVKVVSDNINTIKKLVVKR